MPFEFSQAPLPGLVIIKPKRFADDRGWFQEMYKHSEFNASGITERFLQDNVSFSSKGTLRGLHLQREPHAQGKLVTVLTGSVWDVAVDVRKGSPTRGRWFGIHLSADEPALFYIPPGFAHGFLALEDNTIFSYKCTDEYHKDSEGGIRWDDKDLKIDWPLQDVTVSEKDKLLPSFRDLPE